MQKSPRHSASPSHKFPRQSSRSPTLRKLRSPSSKSRTLRTPRKSETLSRKPSTYQEKYLKSSKSLHSISTPRQTKPIQQMNKTEFQPDQIRQSSCSVDKPQKRVISKYIRRSVVQPTTEPHITKQPPSQSQQNPRNSKILAKAQLTQTEPSSPSNSSTTTESFKSRINRSKTEQNPESSTNLLINQAQEEHKYMLYQSLNFIKTLPQVNKAQLKEKRVRLERRPGYENKKTIVFDLDETLVHTISNVTNERFQVPITFRNQQNQPITIGINIRPYAEECLMEASKNFEVIVFTAAGKSYADAILDYLDPKREMIHHRLYRDSCIFVNGIAIKDLRILGRKASKIVIIDNLVSNFAYQLDNGIPIMTWTNNMKDRELKYLMQYFKILANVPDVRDVNRRNFRLKSYCNDFMSNLRFNDNVRKISAKKFQEFCESIRQIDKNQ